MRQVSVALLDYDNRAAFSHHGQSRRILSHFDSGPIYLVRARTHIYSSEACVMLIIEMSLKTLGCSMTVAARFGAQNTKIHIATHRMMLFKVLYTFVLLLPS